MKPGPKNCITDVSGIKVGHAQDMKLISGTTVILPDTSAVGAVDCRGGAPGTRETEVLHSANLVEEIHAIVFKEIIAVFSMENCTRKIARIQDHRFVA